MPLIWKLLKGVIADQIYVHLDQEKLLPKEQKGCRKGSTGTTNLFYIDRAVITEVKSRNKNLAIAWIDYKKAYDMVPYLWIIECLDLFRVTENIKSLLMNSMDKWKVMLCSGNSELDEVETVTVSTPKWVQITMIYQTDCLLLITMYKSL